MATASRGVYKVEIEGVKSTKTSSVEYSDYKFVLGDNAEEAKRTILGRTNKADMKILSIGWKCPVDFVSDELINVIVNANIQNLDEAQLEKIYLQYEAFYKKRSKQNWVTGTVL